MARVHQNFRQVRNILPLCTVCVTASISPAYAQSAINSTAVDIVVRGSVYSRHDPFHGANEMSYKAVQKSDQLVVAPATRIYTHGVPKPIRQGLHNAIYNLREPTNFVASVMEHKFGRAGQAMVRFTVNSTIGIGGLIDVAKSRPLHIPYRPNSLADVSGFYGVKPGPYFFLPLVGPTTLRDVIGVTVDRAWLPLIAGAPFNTFAYRIGGTVIAGLDDRDAIDGQLRAFRAKSANPYQATRDFYMMRRQHEIDELRHPHQVHSSRSSDSVEHEAPASIPASCRSLAPDTDFR